MTVTTSASTRNLDYISYPKVYVRYVGFLKDFKEIPVKVTDFESTPGGKKAKLELSRCKYKNYKPYVYQINTRTFSKGEEVSFIKNFC